MEVEVKKLKEEITKDFLDKKIRMIKHGAHDYDDEFGNYHRELINLMPWIRPHITKGMTHGGTLHMVKCALQPATIKGVCFPGKVMHDRLKPYMGGKTT